MNDEVNAKLLQLREEYNRKLPEKIALLEIQWQALNNHFDPVLFQTFYRAIHSLSGSAGIYGKEQLSNACNLLADYLKQINGQPTTEQIKHITTILDCIKRT